MAKLKTEFGLKINKFFDGKVFNLPETYKSDFTLEELFITDEGFIGVVMMNSIGFRCGYVGVPTGLLSDGTGEMEIDCHGGITHTGSGILNSTFQEFVGIFEAKKLNKFINFFGWDYGHLGDIPDNDTFLKYCPGHYVMPDFGDGSYGRKMATQEDVLQEVKKVSSQINNMDWNDLNMDVSKLEPKKLKAGLRFSNGKLRFLSKGKR